MYIISQKQIILANIFNSAIKTVLALIKSQISRVYGKGYSIFKQILEYINW